MIGHKNKCMNIDFVPACTFSKPVEVGFEITVFEENGRFRMASLNDMYWTIGQKESRFTWHVYPNHPTRLLCKHSLFRLKGNQETV